MASKSPHAGDWIETGKVSFLIGICQKSPHAGDWIETDQLQEIMDAHKVPSRRGLDRNDSDQFAVFQIHKSPHAGDWIETIMITASTA